MMVFPRARILSPRLGGCILSLALIGAQAGPVAAHPHVFVDTGLKLEVDDSGRLVAIEVSWTYDEFYSMMVFDDFRLDQDFDGRLTEAELGQIQGFDMNWDPSYLGDLYVTRAGAPVDLGAHVGLETTVQDGLITTRHRREVLGAPAAEGVVIKAYDPTYYTAYALQKPVEVGGDCAVAVVPPDLDEAYTRVEELLYAIPADQAETGYPEVGAAFASEVRLECAG